MQILRDPSGLRMDRAAYRTIAMTVSLSGLAWGWAYDKPMIAAAAVSTLSLTLFWRDIRQYSLTPLNVYLLFTIAFYSHRYLFKWGAPEVQTFKEQAPDWLRASKDLVWLVFLLYVALHWLRGRRKLQLKGAAVSLTAVAVFAAIMIGSFIRTGDFSPTAILFYLRYPLEYIPAIFISCTLLTTIDTLVAAGRALYSLLFLVIGFLAYEAATGADNGFNWGGGIKRYGSIFGSPLDLGMFCVFFLVFFLCLWEHIRLSFIRKMLVGVALLTMLFLTVSFGAFLAAIVALTAWLILTRATRKYTLIVAIMVVAALCLARMEVFPYWTNRLGEIIEGRDGSTLERFYTSARISQEIKAMDTGDFLLGSTRALEIRGPFAVDVYYMRIFLGQGVLGLVAVLGLGTALAGAHWKAWQGAREPIINQVSLACLICTITIFASLAIHPRLDMFPTNFYFWLIAGVPLTRFDERRGTGAKWLADQRCGAG
jgi:hypothetical protein